MRRILVMLALAGCESSEADPKPDVQVELASVTLGDDCGGIHAIPPPPKKADADAKSTGWHCTPTSMQLAIKASANATTIKVKKVELLDDKGKALETLASKTPAKWNGQKYVAWNEAVAANETLQATYLLAMPDWNKHTKGRRNAATKKFQVRLTLVVGAQNRTLEKQATVAAYIEPDVDT
jgi:hypothetical protein